jgi:hypothetical protein
MPSTDVKYPEIMACLSCSDGNAFFILGAIQKLMRRADVPEDEIAEFMHEAMSDDYDHLLQTCMKWVTVT